ncbi:MAG: GNAT family N-acetyltransferase [Pseudomonadales bacterium]|jgi:GNAT superfamily N-acetyltransferase|nr:GNAT family N-acetyltransferase [Pseudomonadales bacterium]
MSVTTRAARGEDEARCKALLEVLGAADNQRPAPPGFHAVFEKLLTEERGRVIVAEEAGVVLGMATVSYNVALRYDGEYCQLEELIVDPAARGKNLGGLLVQRTIADASERGCAEFGLYLVVHTEHNRSFYEKYGLRAVGTEMRLPLNSD